MEQPTAPTAPATLYDRLGGVYNIATVVDTLSTGSCPTRG